MLEYSLGDDEKGLYIRVNNRATKTFWLERYDFSQSVQRFLDYSKYQRDQGYTPQMPMIHGRALPIGCK